MGLPYFGVKCLIFQLMIVGVCPDGIIIELPTSNDSSNLIEATVKILKTCYGGRLNTVGIGGNSSDSLISSLSSDNHLSVVLLDNTSRPVNGDEITEWNIHKLQIFVITATSPFQFWQDLNDIKKTRWWNHLAHFYIIDGTPEKNGCTWPFTFLRVAWNRNVLRAKFICNHNARGLLIYSFNPYTSYAPLPWQLEKIYSHGNEHPWTLLVRNYIDDRNICKNMNFDTTKDLGGYNIRMGVLDKHVLIGVDHRKTGIDSLSRPEGIIYRDILHSLNATLTTVNPKIKTLVKNDIGHLQRNYVHSYDYYLFRASVITQYSPDKSQLSKLISVLDITSRIGVCLVFLFTVIFLKFYLHQTPMTAFLNTLRMFCNSCLTKLPIDVPLRFYLAGVFFFLITILGIYQGLLASLLAKRVPGRNINTLQDLLGSHHAIYGGDSLSRAYFGDIDLKGRYVGVKGYACTYHVLRDSSAVCVGLWNDLVLQAASHKLHLMRDNIPLGYLTFKIREDWPLEQRFNIILQRLVESTVVQQAYEKGFYKAFLEIEQCATEGTDVVRKIFNLSDLAFTFSILGIGLTLATLTFIIEIIFNRCVRSRIANARRRFCPRLPF